MECLRKELLQIFAVESEVQEKSKNVFNPLNRRQVGAEQRVQAESKPQKRSCVPVLATVIKMSLSSENFVFNLAMSSELMISFFPPQFYP